MQSQIGVSRVIVVVLDGLRPDAIGRFRLGVMAELMSSGAWTLDATTVRPSVTVAAVTSLLTGVSPDTHGLKGDRVFIPRAAAELVADPGGAGARPPDDLRKLVGRLRAGRHHALEAFAAVRLVADELGDALPDTGERLEAGHALCVPECGPRLVTRGRHGRRKG